MHNHFDFGEPLNLEPDGTYITVGQMRFFFNRENGEELFQKKDSEFIEYYDLCRVYNLVSDLMEKDEESAIMYWDDKKQVVSVSFPSKGSVATALASIAPHGTQSDDDEDDDAEGWGVIEDGGWDN